MYNIYIGSLPTTIDRKELVEYLNDMGFKVSLKINPKIDRRYIMLRTKDKDCYEKLIKAKNIRFKGFPIKPQPYLSGAQRRKIDQELKSRRIYVGKLQQWHTNTVLHRIFENFGKIESCYVSEKCRGKKFIFGFVTFEKKETANALIEKGFIEFEGQKLVIKSFGEKKGKKKNIKLKQIQEVREAPQSHNLLGLLEPPRSQNPQNFPLIPNNDFFGISGNRSYIHSQIPVGSRSQQNNYPQLQIIENLSPYLELLADKVILAKVKLNHKQENLRFRKRS